MVFRVAFVVAVAVVLSAADAEKYAYTYPAEVAASLIRVEAYLSDEAASGDVQALYNVAEYLTPLLTATALVGDSDSVGRIASILRHSAKGLVAVNTYRLDMGGSWVNTTLTPPVPMWVESIPGGSMESVLCSSQFIYAVARTLRAIAEINPAARTPAMWSLATELSNVATYDHIMRWVFSDVGSFEVHGWGCGRNDLPLNHSVMMKRKGERYFCPGPAYCNAIQDYDMWIVSAAVELIAAHDLDSSIVMFVGHDRDRLLAYARSSVAIVASRVHTTKIGGFAFDVGLWDSHPDNAYAQYYGAAFPAHKPPPPVNITWDVSHGSRFLYVFSTFESLRNTSHAPHGLLKQLARQWLGAVYNGNATHPLFANYYTHGGWYRVNYHGKGFGYDVSDVGGSTAIALGYGLLCAVNADVCDLTNTLFDTVMNATTPEQKAWRDAHYFTYWSDFRHLNSAGTWGHTSPDGELRWVAFLPTMLTRV